MKLFEGERLWRALTDFWTVMILLFIVVNFFSQNRYGLLVIPMCVLYTGMLTIYVGTKEFDRWYEKHRTRHPGEWFVIAWTCVIFVLFAGVLILGPAYRLDTDIIAVYIGVLSLYAVTQKSKSLHREKVREERQEEKVLENAGLIDR